MDKWDTPLNDQFTGSATGAPAPLAPAIDSPGGSTNLLETFNSALPPAQRKRKKGTTAFNDLNYDNMISAVLIMIMALTGNDELLGKIGDLIGDDNFANTIQEYRDQGLSPFEAASRYNGWSDDGIGRVSANYPHIEGTAGSLIELIGKYEAVGGSYNSYWPGQVMGDDAGEIPFTQRSIADVMQWQRDRIASGCESSAVGRFQIISGTLEEAVEATGIDTSRPFDEAAQDELAVYLFMEKRGLTEYLTGDITEAEAMKRLSMEWAALPRDLSGCGYYDGDGLNRAHAAPEEVLGALRAAKASWEAGGSELDAIAGITPDGNGANDPAPGGN